MPLKPFLFLVFLTLASLLSAQVDSLGQWRSLQSFTQGSYVTQSEESIIYTSGNVMFYLDKEDLSITPLTRADGLAGGRIEMVKYHEPTSTLVIVYANSTIDLLRDGHFSTLRQIDNFNFSGDKGIYDLAFGEDNLLYIAAGYGVSALSLDEEVFRFTTFTGIPVMGVAEHGGKIYAATEEGLYSVPKTGVNLNDFAEWDLHGTESGLPGDYSSRDVTTWRGRLYFGVGQDVWRLDGPRATLHYDAPELANRLAYLSGGASGLLAGYRCTSGNCADRRVVLLQEAAGEVEALRDCTYLAENAIEDESGRIWFGDAAPIIRYLTGPGGDCITLRYPGPPTDRNFRLLHDGTSLWVAPGQLLESTTPLFDFEGVYRLADGSWSVIDRDNAVPFRGRDGIRGNYDDVSTIIDVTYDPVNDLHYFHSFFEGVISRGAEGELTLLDEINTSIELSPDAGQGRIRAAGSDTDAAGFTYFAISRAENNGIVSVRSPDGQWVNLGRDCDLNLAIDIAVDDRGHVWVLHRGGSTNGITVIDPNGTPLDPGDDPPCRLITENNSALPTTEVRSVAVDLEGSVWIGTTEGIVKFDCVDVMDAENCPGSRPTAEASDGFGGYLLETEEIRSITIDGGNRKWIGTNGGAYLLSEDGREQLLLFDRGNSPLLDDVIKDIAIDPNTGTVYFGTELGIISYRGDATAATETFREELVVFPNPVEPGYEGPIAIDGLARNARVKITDLSGKLVQEGTATGGRFTWQGTDYNGRRVTTGVYLIFATTRPRFEVENAGTAVGKIVFIR